MMRILFVFHLFVSFFGYLLCMKPNIVVVVTDDQDLILGGLTPMAKTLSLIGNEGATYINSFVVSPICCPSRASILSGQYPHNHGTFNNSFSGGCNSKLWMEEENRTFAALLSKQAGYDTFYAGKYLNEYGSSKSGGVEYIPPGWLNWFGLVGNSVYYNFTISVDGFARTYDNGEYLTDIIKERAVNFLKEQRDREKPFLMMVSPPAPHAPFEPAPRHKGMFKNVKAKRTPNFNSGDNSDKHWLMRQPPLPLGKETVEYLDKVYRDRWETLLSVDEMVEDLVQELEDQELLNNTYFIVTSDNGFHMGQFSQVYDKRQPYETDIRVPFLIRGPGIQKKSMVADPLLNIDIAPTILTLAGLEAPDHMDGNAIDVLGSNFDKYTENDIILDDDFSRHFLIEYRGQVNHNSVSRDCPWTYDEFNLYQCYPEFECKCEDSRNNTYSCVRHLESEVNFIYCSFNDTQEFEEAYNLVEDPHQMSNIAYQMLPAVKFKYRYAIQQLSSCKGIECNQEMYY